MTARLKTKHISANDCEVTGARSEYCEESSIGLDPRSVGCRLFPDSSSEWMHGALRLADAVPSGAIVASAGGDRFNVTVGSVYRTSSYTRDGRHYWRYEFEILRE